MESSALPDLLQRVLPEARVGVTQSSDLHPTVSIDRRDVGAVMPVLRDHAELACAVLAELTAVDFWPREPRFEIVYLLLSVQHRLRLRVKVPVPGDDPHVPTVSPVWPAAIWLEREVWDLFGIGFDNHPDLRRLLMPDDWQGHPLRKDYPVQVRMAARTSEPLQVSEQEFRANLERDRRARR